ncbi:adenylate/guanylate cyclase domain-containing protein [Mesorhizobium sp.]|uniref:adenylate/guanylate cyclase domain-containing protein n=1 Tax=Mesorhizobium sp. TaxID=1871066 RepID=UPI000FE519D3|nr:adenylate/guanylate cyclase domain-containing protein [Mesorhizobium sp.]RWA67535.1 MAG: 2Fe-2S iron-sulfur cluster binding domain-containing protein [Mesorhizobium sp.]
MPTLLSLPDDISIKSALGESVLEAARRADVPIACACGGKAKCSTCRIWILDGADGCPERTALERTLVERLGLGNNVRLACQLRPASDITFRRLVLDETDLRMTSQLLPHRSTSAGELKSVVIFFSDVAGFTHFSETLTPYDVMYLLNRYFTQVAEVIELNDGYIDKFVGDGLMAIFGVKGQDDAPVRAVNAALHTLATVDRLKPFFASMYGIDFDIRVGLHLGEAVIGSVGSPGNERLTAIGDAVNVASRVEAANKEAGTRLLITETLYERVKDEVEVSDFIRVRLRGTSDRISLYEIKKLKVEAERRLNEKGARETIQLGGKTWQRTVATSELKDGDHKVIEFQALYVVILRRGGRVYAFNNACPHLKLPFFESTSRANGHAGQASTFDQDGTLVCRWHHSGFDLDTGEIVKWCEALNADGTSAGMEMLGDISKNRAPLHLIPCREEDGYIWVGFD